MKLKNYLKKLFFTSVTLSLLLNNQPVNSAEKEVRLFSGRHYNTDKEVYQKFQEQTGIKVRYIETDGKAIIERLKREGKNSQADLVILVDAARIENASKANLFQKINSNILENSVPNNLRDPRNKWFGLTRRLRVIITNPDIVDITKIKNFEDLTNPSFKGKVCLRNRKSPYNQSLVSNQIAKKGVGQTKIWLKGLILNVSTPYFSGDSSLIRAVGQGTCGIGIVNHYYVARMLDGVKGPRDASLAEKIKLIIPNPAHVNITAGGVYKYAENKTEAIKLLEYLASSEGSQGLANKTYEHPLKESSQNRIVSKFGDFTPDNVTIKEIGKFNSKAIEIMKETGWN